MKEQEGYIKFKYEWEKELFTFPRDKFEKINNWREKFYNMNLIGILDSGIGFGNISMRVDQSNKFIITGSATGKFKHLNKMHYSLVDTFDIESNFIKCLGEIKASSESLTHASIYKNAPSINAIVHTHNRKMWNQYKDNKPTTPVEYPFGTPEIAKAIGDLIKDENVLKEKLIVMGGHEDGLITFGKTIEEAGEAMLDYHKQANKQEPKK